MNTYSRRIWWSVRPLFAWRLVRLLCRSFWLSAALVIAGRLGSAWAGWPLAADEWTLIGAAAFVALFTALALRPVPVPALARRLDRSLDLHDQISTAHEVSRRGPRNYMEARLLDNAQDLLGQANKRFWRSAPVPWGDLELCALTVAALVALAVAPSLFVPQLLSPPSEESALPPMAAEPTAAMPGLPPELSQEAGPFGGQEPAGAGGLDPVTAQQALDALAEAMSQQALTETAGAALAQGDTERAAQELRELADAARDISPEAQSGLGNSLLDAAGEIGEASPELAEELAQAARQLRQGDPATTAGALSDVAQIIESVGDARDGAGGPGGQTDVGDGVGDGAGLGANGGRERASGDSTERLLPEGEVIELPEGDINDQPGALRPPDHQQDPEGQRATTYTQTGAEGGSVGQISDPLSYPWRLRGVVQRYFSAP